MAKPQYSVVQKQPVAEFYYKGESHSHPVKRKVLIHKITPSMVTGYEIREGSEVRPFGKSPLKSYRRDRIARCRQRQARSNNG